MKISVGDYIKTPRFCTVRIAAVFSTEKEAHVEGFTTTTDYESLEYQILGRHIGENRMDFAAIER